MQEGRCRNAGLLRTPPLEKEGEKVTNNDVQHLECTFFCYPMQVNFCLQRKEPKENIEKDR
jgi:hypothetical protein